MDMPGRRSNRDGSQWEANGLCGSVPTDYEDLGNVIRLDLTRKPPSVRIRARCASTTVTRPWPKCVSPIRTFMDDRPGRGHSAARHAQRPRSGVLIMWSYISLASIAVSGVLAGTTLIADTASADGNA